MADRYLIFAIRDPSAKAAIDRAAHLTGFKSIIQTDTLAVLVSANLPTTRFGETGLVFGAIYGKGGMSRRQAGRLDDADPGFTNILQNYWGAYVAVSVGDGGVEVLRDPSGAMPCYVYASENATVFCSDIAALQATGLLRPQIDWDYLAWHVGAADMPHARTGLVGVAELLQGHIWRVDEGRSEIAWSPWDHVNPALADYGSLAAGLRQVVDSTIHQLASPFSRILLTVSGGLDSSIVAASLSTGATPFSCLTMATEDPSGDEREYARLLTDSLGANLHEAFHDQAVVDLLRSDSDHLPRPVSRGFGQAMDHVAHELADVLGVDGYFHGGGGDNIFCSMQSATPIADRLLAEGVSIGALQTVRDICRQTRCSATEASFRAIRRALSARRSYAWARTSEFLGDRAIEGGDDWVHPWLQAPRDALPGKAVHIAMLLRIIPYLEGYPRQHYAPMISPLMAQPIVEFCLSIPTWTWCVGGRNRALARDAFSSILPGRILQRIWKGGPGSFAGALFEANRRKLREFLLSGLLAEHGLLDLNAVADFFSDNRPVRGAKHLHLMRLVDCEAWARSWASRQSSLADGSGPEYSILAAAT